jgi:hypothetical protein
MHEAGTSLLHSVDRCTRLGAYPQQYVYRQQGKVRYCSPVAISKDFRERGSSWLRTTEASLAPATQAAAYRRQELAKALASLAETQSDLAGVDLRLRRIAHAMQRECRTALLQVAPVGISAPATLRPDRGEGDVARIQRGVGEPEGLPNDLE